MATRLPTRCHFSSKERILLVSTPPPLGRTRMHEPDSLDKPLTLWVQTGRLHLTVGDGPEIRLDAGSGIWLPAGTDHDFWTDPGTLVLPIWDRDPPHGNRSEAHPFDEPALDAYPPVDVYAQQGIGVPPQLAGAPRGLPDNASALLLDARPPKPRRGPSARVAAELSEHPDLDCSVEEWSRWAHCSPNTLRRSFLSETGVTFAEWRHRLRLAVAAELLRAGTPVGHVAAAVGYASRWGFANAFRGQFGVPPRDVVVRSEPASTVSTPLARPSGDQAEALSENVMVWLREGELQARFDGRRWIGKQGDVMWLPAGCTIERAPSSAVPLSGLCTDCVRLEKPIRARFSRAWDEWLLWASVSTHSLVRPAQLHGFHPRLERPLHEHVIQAFEAQVTLEQARVVPMPEHAAAREAASQFFRTLGTSAEAPARDLAPGTSAAFQRDTGLSYARWRLAARMRVARTLLQEGVPAGAVSSRVGYTMVSSFSRAFTRFHDIGPREFQALESPDSGALVL